MIIGSRIYLFGGLKGHDRFDAIKNGGRSVINA